MQPGGPQKKDLYGVQNSGCPGNIKNMGCPHPHKSELGDGTRGAGPYAGLVLHSNSFAANLWHGHLTYLQPFTGFMGMLNSCGLALNQGEGSVTSTQDVTGRQSPLVTEPA